MRASWAYTCPKTARLRTSIVLRSLGHAPAAVCDPGSLSALGTHAVRCTVYSVKSLGSFLGTARFVSVTYSGSPSLNGG